MGREPETAGCYSNALVIAPQAGSWPFVELHHVMIFPPSVIDLHIHELLAQTSMLLLINNVTTNGLSDTRAFNVA